MLRNEAYVSFKSAIFEGAISPGQLLSLRELCKTLNVSMAPMRDAAGKLESEGLVQLVPKRGIRIASLDREFIKNAFQVRRMIEAQACREVVKLDDWDDLHRINEWTVSVAARARDDISAELLREAYEVDWTFHKSLIRVLNNAHLTRIHELNADTIRLTRLNARFTKDRVAPAMREHLQVIQALLARDGEGAAEALETHIRISERRALGATEEGLV